MENKPSYYSILTADVRYDPDLCANAKLLFSEITALSNKYGYCMAGNEWFSKLYGKAPETISRWIKQLNDKKYINITYQYAGTRCIERHIYISNPLTKTSTVDKKVNRTVDKKINRTVDENVKDINTSLNNTRVNKKNDKSSFFKHIIDNFYREYENRNNTKPIVNGKYRQSVKYIERELKKAYPDDYQEQFDKLFQKYLVMCGNTAFYKLEPSMFYSRINDIPEYKIVDKSKKENQYEHLAQHALPPEKKAEYDRLQREDEEIKRQQGG